jgi:RNA polymerase sigma-70 factor (ECF subfamily)
MSSSLRSNLTDNELLILLKEGDKPAYTEIYNRYKTLLQSHGYKKLGDPEEVKDILQELFASLWTKREEIPATTNLSGYLYVAMRNKVFNLLSHKQIENRYVQSLQQFIDDGNYITDAIREKEFASLIQIEINALPAKMKEVFILSRKDNLSHKEIALKLKISEQTVSKQITNALKILRIKLGTLFLLLYFIKF